MATKRAHPWRSVVCLTALLVLMVAPPLSAADFGKRQDRQGKYAQWTAEWWQWIFSLPVSNNPLFDETGDLADTAQPNRKAFYLVGVINESNTVKRRITIRRGTPLFGPVINAQNDNISYDPPVTVPQLRADLAALIDLIKPARDLVLKLDGESRLDLVARIKSPVFDFLLPDEDNYYQFLGVDVSGRIKPSVADGYWFYIPPLPPRAKPYTLKFGGSIPDLGFSLEIIYKITVVE